MHDSVLVLVPTKGWQLGSMSQEPLNKPSVLTLQTKYSHNTYDLLPPKKLGKLIIVGFCIGEINF